MLEKKTTEFLEELSSSAPVPGGGGASAAAGAYAAALGLMVGNLTTGKKKYADVEEEIDKFLKVVYMADQKRGQQNFVEISYGDMVVNCKMATMNIDYQLFNREGKPIRAKVQCSFTSVNPFTVRKKDKKKKKDNNNACPPPCSCAEVEKKARASNADFMSIDKPENYMSIK